MNTVAYYVLSEHSRVSEEEGLGLAFGVNLIYAKHRKEDIVEAFSGSPGQVPISMSSPFDPAGDVVDQMNRYIAAQGEGRYLEDKARYEVFIVTSKEGNPPQATCTATIVDRGEAADRRACRPARLTLHDADRSPRARPPIAASATSAFRRYGVSSLTPKIQRREAVFFRHDDRRTYLCCWTAPRYRRFLGYR
jgi:hypothetical protein